MEAEIDTRLTHKDLGFIPLLFLKKKLSIYLAVFGLRDLSLKHVDS